MGKRSNKGLWTPEEDILLIKYIQSHGEGHWSTLPQRAGLQRRSGKGCRLRWMNYLRPNLKRGNISSDEEDLIIRLHKLLGNRWSLIAGRLPNRTDTEIKNYWNNHLKKKLKSNTHHYTTASNSDVEPPKMKPMLQHTNAQLECSKPVANSNYKNLCIPTRDPSNGNFSNGNAGQYNYEVDNLVPQQGPQEVYYLLNNTHFNTQRHYQVDTRNNITYAYETRPINVMDTSCMGSFSNYSVGEYSEINHGNQLGDLSLMSRGQDGFLSTENGFIFHEKPVQQYSSGEYVDGYNYLRQLRKLNVYEDQLSTFFNESISEVGNCIQVGWNDNFLP